MILCNAIRILWSFLNIADLAENDGIREAIVSEKENDYDRYRIFETEN